MAYALPARERQVLILRFGHGVDGAA